MNRLPRWAAGALLAVLALLLLFATPALLDEALARVGVVGVAIVLFVPALLAPLAAARAGDGGTPLTALAGLTIPIVLMMAVASGDERHLRLVPAAAYLGVAAFFHASLHGEDSLIERSVRALLPFAPDFVRGYCRGLTLCWAGFFVLAALVIGRLALAGDPETWRFATGWGIAIAMLVVMPVEFLIRKSWFRYYYFGGPFDRFWSRLFPAEATERGRASLEYIRQYRERARLKTDPADGASPRR
ncbi:MAG: hypothetical protein JRH16_00635 [Deltaproteobacteria bacterium]|nr:hypothetical protein [Deltaproteobacteria bacterium]MBW2363411.1 hypothetical protein [Deltaproteobacteria bacterium]